MTLAPDKLRIYPNLDISNHRITSPETLHAKVRYNCVGWAALGDVSKWWQAGTSPDFYWPKGISEDGSLKSYQDLFHLLGYRQCTDDKAEFMYEKIALYADYLGFTHVAYQLFFGWTSKLGGWEDIHHTTLAALEGPDYGHVSVIMKRRSSLRGYLARAFFHITAKLWPLSRP